MGVQKVLAVLTGGGDCPGLNPCIKAITKKGLEEGYRVIGIREGWRGLLDPTLAPLELNRDVVRHIDRQGGTILGTSRTNPIKEPEGAKRVERRFQELHISALVAIGGEDTLGVAAKLWEQIKLPVVGVPKTIDRDLAGTEYSLGFESALHVITESVDNLRSTAESHSRIFVVEVMGRHAGHLALRGGISAAASVILIPEHPFSVERICTLLQKRKERGVRYSIVMVAEGAMSEGGQGSIMAAEKDAFGHVRLGGIGQELAQAMEKHCGLEARAVVLSHLQRGGKPVAFDRRMGFYFGVAAVQAVQAQEFGHMVALRHGRIGLVSMAKAVSHLHTVDVEKFYDVQNYRAKQSILGELGPIHTADSREVEDTLFLAKKSSQ